MHFKNLLMRIVIHVSLSLPQCVCVWLSQFCGVFVAFDLLDLSDRTTWYNPKQNNDGTTLEGIYEREKTENI